MRKIFLLCLLFVTTIVHAQYDKRLRLTHQFNTDIILSDLAKGKGKTTEIGPVGTGFGGGGAIGLAIWKNWILTLSVHNEEYRVDSASVISIYQDRYRDDNFYTEVYGRPRFSMVVPSLSVSYRILLGSFEVEPYFRASIGNPNVYSNIEVRRKMKNDHYYENYKIAANGKGFFLPNAGAHFNIPIFKWCYGVISTGYGWGKFEMRMTERKTDFWGSERVTRYNTIRHAYSAIQLQASIQVRLGKFPKKPSATDDTKH
jgi:hypothetical protein